MNLPTNGLVNQYTNVPYHGIPDLHEVPSAHRSEDYPDSSEQSREDGKVEGDKEESIPIALLNGFQDTLSNKVIYT